MELPCKNKKRLFDFKRNSNDNKKYRGSNFDKRHINDERILFIFLIVMLRSYTVYDSLEVRDKICSTKIIIMSRVCISRLV